MKYRIAIPMLGKGATNHLHRPEVVDAFRRADIAIRFLVRDDYAGLIEPLAGCEYSTVFFRMPGGWRGRLINFFAAVRMLYPASDIGLVELFKAKEIGRDRVARMVWRFWNFIARYRCCMNVLVRIERYLFRPDMIRQMDTTDCHQVLMLGIGACSIWESAVMWCLLDRGIPVVNLVGNYDNLSSNGYRGFPVDDILVWGPNMRIDAIDLQGIPSGGITMTGPIRYNHMERIWYPGKEAFLESLGLDPTRKTLFFAGFVFEFHYFEMLAIYEEMRKSRGDVQLILRIYPSKILMKSNYIRALLAYASSLPGVYVSIADPHYGKGHQDREVLQIEERELYNAIRFSDVVINMYSTVSLEACIFDTPALNLWYFPEANRALARGPVYIDYTLKLHNRRITSYGAIRTARNRDEMTTFIEEALDRPRERAPQRRATVADECGPVDGQACKRIVEACLRAHERKTRADTEAA